MEDWSITDERMSHVASWGHISKTGFSLFHHDRKVNTQSGLITAQICCFVQENGLNHELMTQLHDTVKPTRKDSYFLHSVMTTNILYEIMWVWGSYLTSCCLPLKKDARSTDKSISCCLAWCLVVSAFYWTLWTVSLLHHPPDEHHIVWSEGGAFLLLCFCQVWTGHHLRLPVRMVEDGTDIPLFFFAPNFSRKI